MDSAVGKTAKRKRREGKYHRAAGDEIKTRQPGSTKAEEKGFHRISGWRDLEALARALERPAAAG